MAIRPGDASVASLSREFGLVPPAPGWWAWAADRHARMAFFAAPPASLALGLAVGESMRPLAGWGAAAAFLLVQPLAEELVFRGVLQGRLRRATAARRLGPLTLANLATSAAFAALHLVGQPPGWALAVIVPSLVFGHLRDRFGSVWPAWVMHVVYNVAFALAAWGFHP